MHDVPTRFYARCLTPVSGYRGVGLGARFGGGLCHARRGGGEQFDAQATVEYVVDGDTINVSPAAIDDITRVRLIGVDTPEVFFGQEPCGPEASAFTKERIEGKQVALEFDEDTLDEGTLDED